MILEIASEKKKKKTTEEILISFIYIKFQENKIQ